LLTQSVRRLYFDIDHLDWTKEETDSFLDSFLQAVKETLSMEIADIRILTNKEEDDHIRSLHLIFPFVKMDFTHQRLLCDYLNDKYNFDLDCRVYTKNRQFRMINQSKMKKKKPLVAFRPIESIEETFIQSTRKCKLLTFQKKYDLEQVQTIKQKIFTPSTSIYETIIENIHPSFWNSKDWGIVAVCLNTFKLCDISQFCKLSVSKATKEYSFENNIHFVKNNTTPVSLNLLYKIVNRYVDIHLYHKEYSIVAEAESYLKSLFSNYLTIIEFLTTGSENSRTYITDEGEETTLTKNGFLKHNNKIVNIYYDFIPLPKEEVEELENIDICKEKLKEWLTTNKSLFVLKSAWGTGKTYHIIKEAVLQHKEDRILFLTESNSLNRAITKQLNQYLGESSKDYFVSHTSDRLLSSNRKVVCSLQSIKKIQYNTFDLIIIDEFESICNALQAESTYKGTSPYQSYGIVIHLLKNCPKTIITDADISAERIRLFAKELETKPVIYKNKTTSFQNTKCLIHTDIDAMNTKVHADILEGKKISYVCSTKKAAKKFLLTIIEYKKTILYAEQEGIFLYENGIYKTIEKSLFLTDIEYHIIENKVDVFIYTPTIKTGISVNSVYFDKTYAVSSVYSIPYKEFLQMIMRVRITGEINMYIAENLFRYNHRQEKIEETNYKQFVEDTLHSEIAELTKAQILEKIENKCSFRLLQVINKNELVNTRNNLAFNLVQLLKYHHLDYSYEIFDKTPTYHDKDQVALLAEETKNEWLNLPVMDIRTYLTCRGAEENGDDFENKSSFYKTKHLFNLFKIEKKILDLLYFYRTNEKDKYLFSSYDIDAYLTKATETTYEYHQHQIDDYVDRFIQSDIYENYFKQNDYRKVFNCRRFFEDLTRTTNFLKTNNFTSRETEDLKKACLQEFIHYFNIKCVGEQTIMSNKEFKTILTEKMGLSVLTLLLNRITKKTEAFCFSNKLHFNHILRYVRECFSTICYTLEYINKTNQSRDRDKFIIALNTEKIKHKKQIQVVSMEMRHTHLKNQHKIIQVKPIAITKERVDRVLHDIYKEKHRITKKELEMVRDYLLIEGGYTEEKNVYFNAYLQENHIDLSCLIKKENEFFLTELQKNKVVFHIPVSVREQVIFNDFEVNRRTIIRLYNINQLEIKINPIGYVSEYRMFIYYVLETYNPLYLKEYELLNDYDILCIINGSVSENPSVVSIRTFLYSTLEALKIDKNAIKWLSYNATLKRELYKPIRIVYF